MTRGAFHSSDMQKQNEDAGCVKTHQCNGVEFSTTARQRAYLSAIGCELGSVAMIDGVLRVKRSSGQLHPSPLVLLLEIAEPLPALGRGDACIAAATQGGGDAIAPLNAPAAPALPVRFGFMPKAAPRTAPRGSQPWSKGSRDVVRDLATRTVLVPIAGRPEYARLSMNDWHWLRNQGRTVRMLSPMYAERSPGQRGSRAIAHVGAKTLPVSPEDKGSPVAELLLACEPGESVVYRDGNPANLLRHNLLRTQRRPAAPQ